MAKVSIIILTKNRSGLLRKALLSVERQTFDDYKIIVINDGSNDDTKNVLDLFQKNSFGLSIVGLNYAESLGVTARRKEGLGLCAGEYVAILDDDDEWVEIDKLKKQVEYLDNHPDCVIVGGGIRINDKFQISNFKFRPQSDARIRKTMLFRNNFFTSTVMFRREAAIKAGGFVKDDIDLAEDYDLWLRMGKLRKMYNFPEVFTAYSAPSYNKDKFKQFLRKQLSLISLHKNDYPYYWLAKTILVLRLFIT